MEKRLVIIDGNSLINRGYYAIQRPMITTEGIYTQGIYAFLSMLSKIRNDYKPTHMLVAFDRKAPTFRHLEYGEYKAGRKGMPVELAMEMPILKDILDAMGIARFEIDGFEADDIIGTASLMGEEAGFQNFVITGDRDALQLATDKTSVIINKKGMTDFKLYDDAAMIEEYGFDHIQFIDYKALRGDTSDNIPGIPGVGEKTAKSLIQEWGSLENIIANVENIKSKSLKEKIEEGAMSAMMSKRLATIVRTVPMEMTIEDFVIKEQNTDALINLYKKLEFKTLLSKLLNQSSPVEEKSTQTVEINKDILFPEVEYINDYNRASEIVKAHNSFVIDFTSDDNHKDGAILSSLEILVEDKAYVFEFDNICEFIYENLKDCSIVGNHLGKLCYALYSNGFDARGINLDFDISVAKYVLSPNSKESSLEELIFEYFHEKINKGPEQVSLFGPTIDLESVSKKLAYIKELKRIFSLDIENKELGQVFYNIEMPLIKVLAGMESEGFYIDKEELVNFGLMLKENIHTLEKEVMDMAGTEFNLNSPKQLGDVLFDKLGLPAGKKTSKGYSTSADILEKLAPEYPIVAKILEYRSFAKLNSTYVEGMLPLIGQDGKIHPHFQQTVTATGRISCTEPNLQNIPIRTELGRQLRKVFKACDGNVLIGADYSQIELRVMASMSNDELLINAFNEGHDIHKETASKVFGVPIDQVTSEMRSNAKAVNFGVIYGMSQYGLSSELTITRKEAEKYINDYFARFRGVKAFLDECVLRAKEKVESVTLYGRKRPIPEINAAQYMVRQLGERLAMNTPIQGTAADIIKIAMIKVFERLEKECPKAKLILQIHDELIIEVPKEFEEQALCILKESMENACELKVQLEISQNVANNWYDLK